MAQVSNLLIAAGLHRGRNTRSQEEDEAQINSYLNWNQYNPNDALRRLDLVDQQMDDLRESNVANYNVGISRQRAQVQDRQINALLDKANESIVNEENYGKLFWFLCLSFVYIIMLVVQGDIASNYALESSIHTTIINQLTSGNGLRYGTSTFVDRASITSTEQFYGWLNTSILRRILTEPICGDGVCEPPVEYPGFGTRFGCIADCGLYAKTTALTIDLQTFLHLSKTDAIGWDLSNLTLRDDPSFTYNIYSETMGDFIFEKDMNPNEKVIVEVPDGNLTLFLYQTAEMSSVIDFQQIYKQLGVLETTLPEREGTTDFTYADKREFIATSTVIMDAISNYCAAGKGEPDSNCVKLPLQDIMLRILGSYGLAGTITASNGGRGRDALVTLPFCSAVPNRTAGLDDPANKAYIQGFSTSCPSRRALQSCDENLARNLRKDQLVDRRSAFSRISEESAHTRSGRRLAYDPGCYYFNSFGEVDCSGAVDGGCPSYWNQVCKQKLPPYFLLPTQCKNHSDCKFAFRAPFCSGEGKCAPCKLCQVDLVDSIDSHCPQDVCPGSGAWPMCVSGVDLVRSISDAQCPSQIPFSVWKYHSVNDEVRILPSPVEKVRMVTPSNMLVGSVVVTQRRQQTGPCLNHHKRSVQDFFKATPCKTGRWDGTPYGMDATFLPSSSIYNGKLQMSDFYNDSEVIKSSTSTTAGVNVTTRPIAIGFFPHQYQRSTKQVRKDDMDVFRLFFDGRISTSQADAMVTYMVDGGFIDEYTNLVNVQFVTFSPTLNKFSAVDFSFDWKFGGQIIWDFSISTFAVDIYKGEEGRAQLALEIVAIVFLAFSTILKFLDLFKSLRTYDLLNYAVQLSHWFHWIHTALMWYGWWLWLQYYRRGQDFFMDPSYPVLYDPQASARQFKTDPDGELKFLDTIDKINSLSSLSQAYRSIAGLNAFLFVFGLLEAFRFQPRLGLISRTMEVVTPDLFNFIILFATIFGGFAVAATLLFGHQVYKVSSMDQSVVFLFFLMISLDPLQFWAEFSHAAPLWAFQLWAWSFTFIIGFGVFQVFLALLIEGLARASTEITVTKPVPEEVSNIVRERINQCTLSSTSHMSDSTLKARMQARKAGLPSSKYLRDIIISNMQNQNMEDFSALCLPGGLFMSVKDIEDLFEASDAMIQSSGPEYSMVPRPVGEDPARLTMASEEEVLASEMATNNKKKLIMNIIDRVSHDSEASNSGDSSTLMQILTLEDLLRNLVMFKGHGDLMEHTARIGRVLVPMAKKMLSAAEYFNFVKTLKADDGISKNPVTGKLNITVVGAENLPKMDLLRSVDSYCVLFIAPFAVQKLGLKCNATKTKVIKNNSCPQWMENFSFDVSRGDEYFILTVFDSDNVTTDDLIGCVVIPFLELRAGEVVDNWFEIELAKSALWGEGTPRMHLQLQFIQQRQEANLSGEIEEWAAT